MKKIVLSAVIFLIFSASAFADDLFIETGSGIFKSLDSVTIFARYQKDAPLLFGYPGHYEILGAYWNNTSHDAGYGFAREVVWSKERKSHVLSTSFGVMGVTRTTDHLGTLFQFYIRAAYNVIIWDRHFSLGLIHISNGKAVLKWKGHNTGENFVTLSVGLF
jgi:hypothetical protein